MQHLGKIIPSDIYFFKKIVIPTLKSPYHHLEPGVNSCYQTVSELPVIPTLRKQQTTSIGSLLLENSSIAEQNMKGNRIENSSLLSFCNLYKKLFNHNGFAV